MGLCSKGSDLPTDCSSPGAGCSQPCLQRAAETTRTRRATIILRGPVGVYSTCALLDVL